MREGIVLLMLIILLGSCTTENNQSGVSLPDFVLEEIDIRVGQFKERKVRECVEKALRLALERVDSTLLAKELLIPIDSLVIQRPGRPQRPEKRKSQDTTPIAPFFQSTETDSM